MRIALASDHAGYAEKERLKPVFSELGIEFDDLGTVSENSVDYPDYAKKVAEHVQRLILSANGDKAAVLDAIANGSDPE